MFVFSVFKQHYYDVAEEYIELFGPRNRIKLTASESRILCTRFTWSAWLRTLKSVDPEKAFQSLGYTWIDNTPVAPHTMPGYVFDPILAGDGSPMNDDDDQSNKIDQVASDIVAMDEHVQPLISTSTNQKTLLELWKRKKIIWSFVHDFLCCHCLVC